MKDRGSVSEALDTLRPDAFIEDAYRRHRSGDLARAFQTRRTPRRARRFSAFRHRPFILVAGGAVAGLAAAALVVPFLGGGGAGTGSPDLDTSAGPSVSAGKPQSTRTILLAAAESAAKAPADSGRFWFSRVRTAQLMRADPTKRVERKQALVRLPYTAWRSDTTDTWRSLTGKGGRRVSNQDVKVVFKGSEDEAEWKRAGSPDLAGDTKARTAEGTPQSIVSIDNPGFTWSNVAKLPTGKAELEAKLKGLYPRSQSKERGVSFAGYLWATGADLLTAPITPGTRSALFEVLADSASGLKSQAGVKDALGRTGVALETTGPDDAGRADRITYRLIFDDKTGAGLELSVIEEGVPLLQQTFQSTGYVDKLGDTPQR